MGFGNRSRGPRRDNNNAAGGRKFITRIKVCAFCTKKIATPDYKDKRMQQFVSERGKILPRRRTGTCAKHQRGVTTAIKRARHLALLPFVATPGRS